MIILNVKDLSFSFGVNRILEAIGFSVDSADRCGVVGVNGAGKSTLFALLAGEYEPDGGDIQYAKGTSIGYFRQNNDHIDDATIGDAARRVFADVLSMEAELSGLADKLDVLSAARGGGGAQSDEKLDAQQYAQRDAKRDTQRDEQRDALISKYDNLRLKFELAGGYEYRSRIRGVLNGLDIGEGIDDTTPVSILSGGQKTRLALALMLIKPPDLLLLDEPTNHLDVGALEWLESYLKNYKKSLLIISHDRYFLDAVTTRTFEIEYKRLTAYAGGYTEYVKKREEDRAIQERRYENQQREIARIEAIIEQYRRWNTERSHIMAKSREKALNRIERVGRPASEQKKINIRFDNTISNSQDALYIDGLAKAYSGRRLFEPFSATVRRNDRIMILGPNGCGKSTLLRMLSGQLVPDCGMIEAGGRIEMSFFDQEQIDLDEDNTVFDEVYDEKAGKTAGQFRNLLGAFLFSGDDINKKISMLSGGEKARVALVKIVLSRANMLLLDEPTNHLDINSREKLEEALLEFNGVILAVSHDRYLIKKLATRIFYFENGRINDFAGGYDDLQRYLEQHRKPASGKPVRGAGGAEDAAAGGPAPSAAKLNWLAERENRSKQKKSETRLAKIEDSIETAEKRIAEISALMKSGAVVSDHVKLIELSAEQEELSAELEILFDEWEKLSATVGT